MTCKLSKTDGAVLIESFKGKKKKENNLEKQGRNLHFAALFR